MTWAARGRIAFEALPGHLGAGGTFPRGAWNQGGDRPARPIDAEVFVLELARLEFLSAIHRRFRGGELVEYEVARLLEILDQQLLLFRVVPLGHAVLREAELLMSTYGPREYLRTLDALHLAAFNLIADTN